MPTSLADGRAPIVRVGLLTVFLAVLVVFASTANASAAKRHTHRASQHTDRVEAEVIDLLNNVRQEQGLPTLRRDSDLSEAADAHSRGMIASGVFSHDSASGTRCDVRIRRFERARMVGETISWLAGTPSSQQAQRTVELWMNSPPHRETLLTKSFRRIGVSRKGGEMFGRRGVAFTADLAG